jgi:hypothetical protein
VDDKLTRIKQLVRTMDDAESELNALLGMEPKKPRGRPPKPEKGNGDQPQPDVG